ncbi:uncharacterized protein [Spinacia oleracea]|uniref:OmpA-like domain-containing protein n=1 Tax=Spinacia oleracea TaxID=3562 RepID=A0A9R0IBV7_SPIOL|nr:uncharacterized protein LOC110785667 [Spinacia oleracea]
MNRRVEAEVLSDVLGSILNKRMSGSTPNSKLKRIRKYIDQERLIYAFQIDQPEEEKPEEVKPTEDNLEGAKMVERTLKEMAAPNTGDDPLCIVFLELEKPLKLNSGFLNLLPKYYGKSGENPYRHLKEFKVVCSSMNLEGVEQDHIRLHAFPFSLQDLAKDWLYDLPAGSITTWNVMASTFLGKYFPASLIGSIRKEICGIRQNDNESLYEYWERFKRLCSSCPQHQISDQLLIQYFYEGLCSSGGTLVDKTPTQARALFSNMAQNTQQHGSRNDVKRVNGVDLSGIQNQLQENAQQIATLTTLVSKIVASNESKVRVCGICCNESHPTDKCPELQSEDVNAIGGYSGQRKYDPYSQTYNEGWKDHPNLRYGNRPQLPQSNQPRQYGQQNPPPQSGPSLEDLVKQLTNQIGQVHNQGVEYQKKTNTHLHHIDTQIGQICTSLCNLETQLSGKLPSQTIPNPNGHVKAVTLRSGKVLTEPKMKSREVEKEIEVNPKVGSRERVESEGTVKESENEKEGESKTESDFVVSRFKDLPPFPSRFAKAKKESLDNEILETFRKIEVNIPLLDAIKQVPRYAKFLKELCTNKRHFRPSEKVSMGENISAIIQKKLPLKCKDPGMFRIPCKIGDSKFESGIKDFGTDKTFKVNGHRLKPFYDQAYVHMIEDVTFEEI